MDFTQIRNHRAFTPVVISLSIHLVFVSAAMLIHLPGWVDDPKEKMYSFHMKSADMNPMIPRAQGSASKKASSHSLKFVDENVLGQKSVKDVSVEKLLESSLVNSKQVDGDLRSQRDTTPNRSKDLNTLLIRNQERQMKEKID